MAGAKKKQPTTKKPKSATKQSARSKGKGSSRRGAFAVFLRSEQFARIRGAFYIMFSLFLLVSLAGYYATGCGRGPNWLGSLGGSVAAFFSCRLFGIGSMGFSLLFFVYGMRLWNVVVLPWWKTLGCTVFWMLWLSVTLGYIGVLSKADTSYEPYAGIGLMLGAPLQALLSWWTLVLLVFVAILFLVFVHKMELPEVHLPKVDLKKAVEDFKQVATEKDEPAVEKKKDDFIDLNQQKREEDDGADFDEAAMSLFHTPSQTVSDKEEVKDLPVGDEPAFNIDDEFARINALAQAGQPAADPSDQVSFTIEDNSEVSDNTDNTEDSPEQEELEEDDYRRHYGIDEPFDPHLELSDYQLPATDLLDDSEVRNVKVSKEELVANKDRIVQTLHDYGIEITEITAQPGPTVTLYKIKPAPGVRISKIKNLEDDIALSLAALGIRIIAPIPGESNVGIEVPNAKPQIVSMKTMLESDAFQNAKMELPIAFGKTISNECFVTDLAKMPHLLMAGATGTGKSVGLNAVLASLLYKKHPSELKLVLVDPKKVEFSLYSALERHYLAKMPDEEEAVITDVKKVVRTLNSLCLEMDSRYDLLKQAKVRKITEYNEKFCKRMLNPEHGHRFLPYIVVVIDEFGDLIMTAGKEVELPIARLAQLARAVGIHLIIATQRPTTNIITGTIKANFPARVAFRVTSGIDSKTILDTGGAQQLIGRGDMLISLAGKDMIRLQCALIDTPEIERLVRFIGDQRGYPQGFELPEYLDENEEPNKDFDAKHKDEFFNDAARLVVASQFGSTSLLQRKLQLGYNRAGRIIDQLEAAGIVGPSNGSKPRDVLIHDEISLEELLKTL
jgi:S-DNA-T family DNA segregation ATPase FtsK/SpoIIIE